MKTYSLKLIHEKCLLLLENIDRAEKRKESHLKDAANEKLLYPFDLSNHYKKRAEVMDMCIFKMERYYNYLITKL